MPLQEVKKNFRDVVLLVGNGRQRILIQEKGRDRAALIPLEDLALLENLDGDRDVAVEHVSIEDVRRHLSEDLALVADRDERILVQDRGVDLACLVPGRDLAVLENLDASLDMEAARRSLEKMQHDKRGDETRG